MKGNRDVLEDLYPQQGEGSGSNSGGGTAESSGGLEPGITSFDLTS